MGFDIFKVISDVFSSGSSLFDRAGREGWFYYAIAFAGAVIVLLIIS